MYRVYRGIGPAYLGLGPSFVMSHNFAKDTLNPPKKMLLTSKWLAMFPMLHEPKFVIHSVERHFLYKR